MNRNRRHRSFASSSFLLALLLSGFSALDKTLFFLPTPRGAIIRRQNSLSLLSLAEKEGFPVSAEKDLPFPYSGSQQKEGEGERKPYKAIYGIMDRGNLLLES